MKDKINVAELLKDCLKGMELDCTMYDNLYFNQIYDDDGCRYKIGCYTIVDEIRTAVNFTEFGTFTTHANSKCVIFPKGKTTWEGFVPPVEFKDGDIVFSGASLISIFKGIKEGYVGSLHSYVSVGDNVGFNIDKDCWTLDNIRLATEEEKAKLFQAIKDNGYKWNPETKTLEKLIEPKFHEGDWVVTDYGKVNQVITVSEDGEGFTLDDGSYFSGSWKDMYHLWTIQDAKDGDVLFHSDSASNGIFIFKEIVQHGTIQEVTCYCDYDSEDGFCLGEYHTCCWTDSKILHPATKERCDLLFQKMKKAGYKWDKETKTLEKLVNKNKFAIGDTITNGKLVGKIRSRDVDSYQLEDGTYVFFNEVHNWKLAPNKFDITTLIPFESKVLVRNDNGQRWIPAFWGGKREDGYVTTFGWSKYCVPYEGNKHLLDKTNDCDSFYKTWE